MKLTIFLIGLLLSNILYAQDYEKANISGSQQNQVSRYWSEFPADLDRYPKLAKTPWLEANALVEFFVMTTRKRAISNQDDYSLKSYISFRPYILDFNSFSLALGISHTNRISKTEGNNMFNETIDELFGTPLSLLGVVSEGIETKTAFGTISFSMLGSFPEHRFQFIADAGYGFSKAESEIDFISANVLVGTLVGSYDEYQFKQRNEYLYLSLNLLKTFERDYLNFFHFSIFGAYRLKTTFRDSRANLRSVLDLGFGLVFEENSGRQDLPFEDANFFPFSDPQLADEFDFGFVNGELTVRLITIYTPWVENHGLSLSAFSSIQHVTGQLLIRDFHGYSWRMGGIISIFNAVSVKVVHILEENNDSADAWEVTVGAVVSGLLREVL